MFGAIILEKVILIKEYIFDCYICYSIFQTNFSHLLKIFSTLFQNISTVSPCLNLAYLWLVGEQSWADLVQPVQQPAAHPTTPISCLLSLDSSTRGWQVGEQLWADLVQPVQQPAAHPAPPTSCLLPLDYSTRG